MSLGPHHSERELGSRPDRRPRAGRASGRPKRNTPPGGLPRGVLGSSIRSGAASRGRGTRALFGDADYFTRTSFISRPETFQSWT